MSIINYDEFKIKYLEGGLTENLKFLVKNLEQDEEVIKGSSREKVAARKFLTDILDQLEEFVSDGNDDPRNNLDDADVFGDEDIVVRPDGPTSTTFMDPPADGGKDAQADKDLFNTNDDVDFNEDLDNLDDDDPIGS